jgi:hypothetical protein
LSAYTELESAAKSLDTTPCGKKRKRKKNKNKNKRKQWPSRRYSKRKEKRSAQTVNETSLIVNDEKPVNLTRIESCSHYYRYSENLRYVD